MAQAGAPSAPPPDPRSPAHPTSLPQLHSRLSDLGAHIDGFIAVGAHTAVVGGGPVTGKAADVVAAAAACMEAALRLIRPGKRTVDVAPVLEKVAACYGCTLVEGVMSHQLKQFVIDGNKCVLNRPTPEQRVEDEPICENEAWQLDVVLSTGDGKARVLDERATTVYKRALDAEYSLKMKASRAVFGEVCRRFPATPFTLRALEAPSARLGLVECVSHGLVHPYPVLHERAGELTAQARRGVGGMCGREWGGEGWDGVGGVGWEWDGQACGARARIPPPNPPSFLPPRPPLSSNRRCCSCPTAPTASPAWTRPQ